MNSTSIKEWAEWAKLAPLGQAESIYYILAVPMTWVGSAPGMHLYSGLHFKIGRSRNVRKRLENLRTGTSDNLIIHALEPGSATRERELHAQFKDERRQGEWFAATPALVQHVHHIWGKYSLLPPEHQMKLVEFREKAHLFRGLRKEFKFDTVNPSLNEPWGGTVFLDLTNKNLVGEDND